jgi:hypothetical protein
VCVALEAGINYGVLPCRRWNVDQRQRLLRKRRNDDDDDDDDDDGAKLFLE